MAQLAFRPFVTLSMVFFGGLFVAASAPARSSGIQGPAAVTARDLLAMSPDARELAVRKIVESESERLRSPTAATGIRKSGAITQRDRQRANALRAWFLRELDASGRPESQPPYGLALLPQFLTNGQPVVSSLLRFIDEKVDQARKERLAGSPGRPDWLEEKTDSYQEAFFRYESAYATFAEIAESKIAEMKEHLKEITGCPESTGVAKARARCTETATFSGVTLARWLVGNGAWYLADGRAVPWLSNSQAGDDVFDHVPRYDDGPRGLTEKLEAVARIAGTKEKIDLLPAGPDGSRFWILRGPNIDPVPVEQIIIQSANWMSLDPSRTTLVTGSDVARIPCIEKGPCVYRRQGSKEDAVAYLEIRPAETSTAGSIAGTFSAVRSLYRHTKGDWQFNPDCQCIDATVATDPVSLWPIRK